VDWLRGGEPTSSGVTVDENSALNYSAVWAATCIISETVASLPLLLYRRLPNNGKERASNHQVYNLLHDEPNAEMDAVTFWSDLMPDVLNWGYGIARIETALDQKTILGLWPVAAAQAKPKRAKDAKSPGEGIKPGELYFEMRNEDGTPGDPLPFRKCLVIPGRMPKNGIGRGVIRQARESIGMGLATERYGAGLFGNGARPGGFLTVPKETQLSDTAKDRLLDSFNRKYGGVENANKVALLRDGITYAPSFIPPEDAQFLQTRQHNITEIARWYRLPPHLLADLSRATFSNIDSETLSFVIFSMTPWFTKIEAAVTRQLLSPEDKRTYFAEFLMDALLRGDPVARATSRQIEFMNGALTIDEWRSGENRNPLSGEGGKVHFVPANLLPIEKAIKEQEPAPSPQAETPPQQGAENEPDDEEDPQMSPRSERYKQAARDVLSDAIGRMLTKECNAAKRAASKPNAFVSWMDDFYAGHETLVLAALRPGVSAWLAAIDASDEIDAYASSVASRHVEESRRRLLEAAECQAVDLPERVAACVASWQEQRRAFPLGE